MSDYPLGVHYFETNCQSDTHTHTHPPIIRAHSVKSDLRDHALSLFPYFIH